MSGHSKWHNIQAKKGKADAARGKLILEIPLILPRHVMKKTRKYGENPRLPLDKAAST